ncbi:helix-turn-helix domain-containing protein [Microbispora sp. SCL1-1]|uniref:helix-turn-helix domain-containing protein n=1 Tax=unclassified Microbispora TaxID=2614687 RepID=UPI001159AA76|nr:MULTISPECIES: helix-turn-helix domain-containing protein [unclassified Microbispora]NJP27066.1 helix-turn-helix domain-containing protein [Microbispora sp. CL1-1]TQS11414.1 helix-turn-helix domain-containing protein [Microbispora sp. SCL1-1]
MATATREKTGRPLRPRMPVPDPEVQPLLTVPEMGLIFGMSRASAYKAAHSDDIPTIRVGKLIMIPTAKLRELLGLS